MRVRDILGVALIAAMSVACGKPDVGNKPPKVDAEEPQTLYVKAITTHIDAPGVVYNDALNFTIDSEKRITSMRSVYVEDGVEYADPVITIEYGEGTATINYSFEEQSGNIYCTLNEKGAILRAEYDGMMNGMVEEFTYSDSGEIMKYVACYANFIATTLTYEWRDGNIYKVNYEDSEDKFVFTHEYTAEPNIYNIDIFPGCTLATPIICELALAVNDGLLGKKNRGFLKSVEYNGYTSPVFDYTFKANGELERAAMDGYYMTFDCFEVL